jgi:hypothetical protein
MRRLGATIDAVEKEVSIAYSECVFVALTLLSKKIILLISTNLPEIFFIVRRIEQHIIINICWYSYKVPLIHVRFY